MSVDYYLFLRRKDNKSDILVLVIHDKKRELDLEYELDVFRQILWAEFLVKHLFGTLHNLCTAIFERNEKIKNKK